MKSLYARRLALFALFALPGLAISSWVTRTPTIRDVLGASTSEMGLILLGLSAGSMIGILSSGPAVSRCRARPVMIAGTLGVVMSMPMIGIGVAMGSTPVTVLGLFLFRLGMVGGEIAMNVEGRTSRRRLVGPYFPLSMASSAWARWSELWWVLHSLLFRCRCSGI